MLNNYIKIAWRNLTRHKSYTLINLFGLTVGMVCCILIALYVREELSYNTFHEKAERIVAVGSESSFSGRGLATPYPLADVLIEEVPEVEEAIRIRGTYLNLSRDGQTYIGIKGGGKYTEPGFFNLFSFDLIKGNTSEALAAPNSIVLTKRISEQIFGAEDPMGKSLYWQQRDTILVMEVTGVVENPPLNTTINFEVLISYNTLGEEQRRQDSWNYFSAQTFALLKSSDALKTLPGHLRSIVENHYERSEGSEDYRQSFFTLPLIKLHLSELTRDDGFTGNRAYIYLFGSVALFILIIACANYVNLATARSSLRSKEVGVRKTLGAGRRQIAGQFLGESVVLCIGSFSIGLLIASLVLPYFNQTFGTSIEWENNTIFLLQLALVSLAAGIIAGIYPSVYLSRFSPVSVLRSRLNQDGSGGILLRKALIVGQFVIALVLIIGSLVVYRQLHFTQTKDLGFDGEQVVSVNMPNRKGWWNKRETIRNRLADHPEILSVSTANGAPGEFNIRLGQKPQDLSSATQIKTKENVTFAPAVVDYNFLDVLGIELLVGRNFSREIISDIEQAYILNKTGAEMLGWTPEEAVGKPFNLKRKNEGKVIGVVEDFHISSLHDEIEGVVLQLQESSSWSSSGTVLAKLAPDQISSAMDFIKEEVTNFVPGSSFNYEFIDDRFDAMYRTERRLGQIVGMFTFIAIVITCLGLYGLAAFSTERRVKEIGIRKVLGATITSIISLLSKDFLKLVALGFVIAAPIAWYAMHYWLQDFAYRIELGPGIFALSGGAAFLIALLTVSWQSIRAALANPVESLRSE